MTFVSRRIGWAAAPERSWATGPFNNQHLLSCCRHLADRVLEPAGSTLSQDIATVGREFDRVMADRTVAEAIAAGAEPWPVLAPRLLDLLLGTAETALATDPSLTALIADTVLRAQRDCLPAWRLRARANEQWGDLNSAIAAHEEYLARTPQPSRDQAPFPTPQTPRDHARFPAPSTDSTDSTGSTDSERLGVAGQVSSLRALRDARAAVADALIDAHDNDAG